MDDLLADFLTETNEALADLDLALVKLERAPDDAPTLSLIFRRNCKACFLLPMADWSPCSNLPLFKA